jgi:hypothetical protein
MMILFFSSGLSVPMDETFLILREMFSSLFNGKICESFLTLTHRERAVNELFSFLSV